MDQSKLGFNEQIVRSATWAAAFLTAAALALFLFAATSVNYQDWQDYILVSFPLLMAVASISSIFIMRRGNLTLGSGIVFSLNLVVPLLFITIIQDTLWTALLYAVISSVLLIWRALPQRSWRWSSLVTVVVLIVIVALDFISPLGRFRNPPIFNIFIVGVIAVLFLAFVTQFVRQMWGSNIRVRLLTSSIGISVLAVIFFGVFVLYRNQQTENTWSKNLQDSVRKQSQQEMTSSVTFEAHTADEVLSRVAYAVQELADYQASLFTSQTYFGQGGYWDGNSKLIKKNEGQYSNSKSEPGAVFIPNYVTLSPSLLADLNTSLLLDFAAPAILKENSNIVAVYYNDASNFTVYYPNIDLSSLVPADFEITSQPFYTVATPQNDPERKAVWTKPYQDPAGTGLIVTYSVPVYDQYGQFRGVISADVQLAKLTENISTLNLGKTGFAFLIDPEGRIIAMPENGYRLFGVQPESVPVGETPKVTLFSAGSTDFQNILRKMTQGANGLETIQFQDKQYYISYTPVPVIGYSMGLIAPTAELDQAYVQALEKIETAARSNLYLFIIALVAVILAATASGFFMSQSISVPLIQLTQVAEEVSKGRLNAKANIQTNDEIGALASTFNNMTAQLQETLQGLEQRVAARTKDLATVAEVGTATATILESKRLLQEVVDLTKERFNLYHSHIYLLDDKGENLVLAAGAGEPGRAMVAEGRSIPLAHEQSLVARAAREQKGVIVNDVTQTPDFLPNPLLPDTRSELAVPMIVAGNLIGVFDIQSEQVGRFTDSDINIQTTLAAQLATSIQNVRSFERSRKQAELESMVNVIGQRIQRTISIEETLQTAVRELGMAVGASRVKATISAPKDDGNL